MGRRPASGRRRKRRAADRAVVSVAAFTTAWIDGVAVGLADLVRDVPDLVHPAALDGDAGIDHGQGSEQTGTAVDADHLEARAFEATAEEIAEEQLPLGGALGHRQAVIDDLLPAVGPEPKGHQDGAAERAGLARKHHAVERQDRVMVLQGPTVEGGDRRIQGLDDLAYRVGAASAPVSSSMRWERLVTAADPTKA